MKIWRGAFAALLVLLGSAAEGQTASIVVCSFNHEAAFFVKPDRIDAAPHRAGGKGFELIFANLDTDSPRLKAQLGEGPLNVILRRGETSRSIRLAADRFA